MISNPAYFPYANNSFGTVIAQHSHKAEDGLSVNDYPEIFVK